MTTKSQLTGMTGVYLVASQLSRRGFIVSPTSRSAQGVDLLASTPNGKRTLAIEVKSNARTFNFWLLGKRAKETAYKDLFYVLVNIREGSEEYFVVPSKVVAKKMTTKIRASQGSIWRFINLEEVERYRGKWDVLAGRGANR